MTPILYWPEADPDALLDVNAIPLFDVNDEQLLAMGDATVQRVFDSYGRGALTDCIKCEVREERNGSYEMEMDYPVTGAHYDDIELRCIVMARPNYSDDPQAFRIYFISTPIDGVVHITARHLSYDLSGVPVLPFTAQNCAAACAGLISHAAIDTPFEINTQLGTIADFEVDVPSSVRSWFGGKEGSLIDVYGGEWAYDNYTCTLKSARGQDRGVVIRYGKNLIDFEQEKNCEEVWTGVLPYWADEEGHQVRANIINVAGQYDYRRILVLDMSQDFEEQPTAAQLTAKAQTYIHANNIGVPKVNITLDWVQTSELSDRVDLCDTVLVEFERIGVSAKAKCISTTWDVLKDRYSKIEFGEPKTNITDTIAGMQDAEKKQETSVSNAMLRAIANATALITGNSGGYVVMHDGDGDGYPDELLVMNTPDVETATSVWRFNKSGLGFSGSGYGGPYGLAMTANGEIVADFITTGALSADRINGGTITGVAYNNGSGTFQVDTSGNVTANSLTSSNATITGGDITLTTQNILSGLHLRSSNNNANKLDIGGYIITKETASGKWRWTGMTLIATDTSNTVKISLDGDTGNFYNTGTLVAKGAYSTTSTTGSWVRILSDGTIVRDGSSSKRYKHDITSELTEDPEKLYDVEVRQYKYNDDYLSKDDQRYGKDIIGFIAEEVAEAMPGAVDYDDEGRPEMWNVHVIVPAMLKLIQEQKKEIDELRARLDRLEARFSDDGR